MEELLVCTILRSEELISEDKYNKRFDELFLSHPENEDLLYYRELLQQEPILCNEDRWVSFECGISLYSRKYDEKLIKEGKNIKESRTYLLEKCQKYYLLMFICLITILTLLILMEMFWKLQENCKKGSEHSIVNTGKEDLVMLTVVVKR